jgi:hypothetical protein
LFAALTEKTLKQHSTVPQQTFPSVVILQWHILSNIYLTAVTDRTERKKRGDKLQLNGQRDGKKYMKMKGRKDMKRKREGQNTLRNRKVHRQSELNIQQCTTSVNQNSDVSGFPS